MINMSFCLNRRSVLIGTGGAVLGALAPASATWAATSYPERAVRLVVPWTAGGSTDALARAVAQSMGETLGNSVIVENRPGASGRLGVDGMVKAPADGYTAAVIELAHAIAPSVFQKVSYNLLQDTTAISLLGESPLVLFVAANQYKEGQFDKFLTDAKRASAPFTLATSGNGSISHLAAGLLSKETRVTLEMIPYKGSAPALTDVAAGIVSGHCCTLASAASLLSAGKIVPLFVTGESRIPQLPNTPSAVEVGLKTMNFVQWWAMVAPSKTPQHIADKLYQAAAASLKDDRVKNRISSQGIDLKSLSPAETKSFIRAEADKWAKVVADLGIKPE